MLHNLFSASLSQPNADMASGKSSVEYNFLGNSGLKVSNICLGTMTFGTMTDGPMAMVSVFSKVRGMSH